MKAILGGFPALLPLTRWTSAELKSALEGDTTENLHGKVVLRLASVKAKFARNFSSKEESFLDLLPA